MNNLTRRLLMVLLGILFTAVAVAGLAEMFQLLPLPNVGELAEIYWTEYAYGGQGTLEGHMGYVMFMLTRVWILWVIPLFGILGMWLAWQSRNDEELTAYLERIHMVEQALREARERADDYGGRWEVLNRKLDELFEATPEAWLVVDNAKGIRRWNRAAMELAQRTDSLIDTLEGRPLSSVVNAGELMGKLAEVMLDGRVWKGEFHAVSLQQWLLVWMFPLGTEVAIVLRDVTHQHRDHGFLQSSEALVRQLVEDSVRPVAVLDAGWRYLYVSRKWHEVMGLPAGLPLLRKDHRDVVPDFPGDVQVLENQLAHGQLVGREEEPRVMNGREVVLNWHIRPWHDAGGRLGGYIFTVMDMTDAVRLRQQVAQAEERENALAYSDALTGLPNRQLFNDRLNMALAQAYRQLGKVALFFLDLDGFKQVNDQMGHDYGDMLLKQVAQRLQTCVRQTDTVARLGGDEFTIILAIRDRRDAEQVAEKILKTIREPYDLSGKIASKVGTSIGIALYPQDGAQAADLMKKADNAMYSAKQSGKNTFRFSTVEIKVQA